MNIYVGNLPYSVTEEELRETFQAFGDVSRATVIMDRETARPKGFGFVEMPSESEGRKAVDALNDTPFKGRTLRVSEARPRDSRAVRPGR